MSKQYYETEKELEESIDADLLKDMKDGENANHYVDNERLCKELAQYRNEFLEYKERLANGEEVERPKMSDYVGECILLITERFAMNPSYANYPHLDLMMGDAIENCVRYIHNFNPEKSDNAFAYVTQQVKRAFWRRIKREKKELYKKALKIQRAGIEDEIFDAQDQDMDQNFRHTFIEKLQESTEIIEDFEEDLRKQKEKQRKRQEKKRASLEEYERKNGDDK